MIYINSWPGVDKDGIADRLADILRPRDRSRETFVVSPPQASRCHIRCGQKLRAKKLQKWSSARIDEHAQTALADGADDTHQEDQQRLRGREEFLRGLVEDPRTGHHM